MAYSMLRFDSLWRVGGKRSSDAWRHAPKTKNSKWVDEENVDLTDIELLCAPGNKAIIIYYLLLNRARSTNKTSLIMV